jgi:hypothetical protein
MREKDQDIVGRILQPGARLMQHSSCFRRDPAKLTTVVDVRQCIEHQIASHFLSPVERKPLPHVEPSSQEDS